MKYTLLDLTQTVLSSIDGDEINSINDSVESRQVVNLIRTAYFDIVTRANLPEHYSLTTLDASTDSLKPVLMTVPSTVAEIIWLKYDKHTTDDTRLQMEPVWYQTLPEFTARMHSLDTTATNVDTFAHTIGTDTFTILYTNDAAPTYFTTFNDSTILFDSYDATVDSTLQKSKTLAYSKNVIPFTESDTFTPALDEPQFGLLVNESKALAWAELRQTQNAKAEVGAMRGWTSLQRKKNATPTETEFEKLPNYGRR